VAASTVRATLKRFTAAGLSWPLPDEMTDAVLEARLSMTANRWQIIKVLIGAGPVSIRETARKVGKDVSGVHKDVRVLLDAGILRKAGDKIEFPYSGVHLDATLTQEAAE
jgi:predicted transcriptional regulator